MRRTKSSPAFTGGRSTRRSGDHERTSTGGTRISIRLNDQQTADWIGAVQSVEEIAANTDSHSTSKPFIDTMARFVRDEPHMVVRLLTLV